MESSQQPAGWYDDPEDGTQLRYWNGSQWTDDRSPKSGASPAASPGAIPVAAAPAAARQTNGKATASLVLGLVSLLIPILGILALIFGFIARSEIGKNPNQTGDGMALAGIICGALGLLSIVFWYSVYS